MFFLVILQHDFFKKKGINMIYEIYLKTEKITRSTNVLIKATNKIEALSIFKRQRFYEPGVSKKDFFAEPYIVDDL